MNNFDESHYTAYCGLYCRDCIPSRTDFFVKAVNFREELRRLRFDQYAELKAGSDTGFAPYADFISYLDRIIGLECSAPCRLGGGKPSCEIRDCVLSRSINGCWECGDESSCLKLKPLNRHHPHLVEHKVLIRRHGMEEWAARRKSHYGWEIS